MKSRCPLIEMLHGEGKLIVVERRVLISSFFFSFRERRIHAFYTAIYLTIYANLISFPLFEGSLVRGLLTELPCTSQHTRSFIIAISYEDILA
jgi:hypothetical protein